LELSLTLRTLPWRKKKVVDPNSRTEEKNVDRRAEIEPGLKGRRELNFPLAYRTFERERRGKRRFMRSTKSASRVGSLSTGERRVFDSGPSKGGNPNCGGLYSRGKNQDSSL